MGDYRRQVPEGVADILADECAVKREAEAAVRGVFLGHGLREVCTPAFEYLDVFSTGQAVLEQEQMFKLTDPKGRILVIRPDITIPIARMAATNMKGEPKPHKLFYISEVFRVNGNGADGLREFTQAGVEMIGIPGVEADGECISIAIQAMKTAGIEDFRIDIGQVEFLESIIDEIKISGEDKEDLRNYIKHKNLVAVEEFLDKKKVNGKLKELLLLIPVLYGNAAGVLKKAGEFPLNRGAEKALEDIEKAFSIINEYGYGGYISIDLGMVKELPYYTGMIFKGFTRDLGYIICSGGRYDYLQKDFGEDAPATGFAININRVVQALYKQNPQRSSRPKAFILKCSDGDRKKAIRTAQKLRAAGFYIELDMSTVSMDKILTYAREKGVGRVITLQEGSRLKVMDVETGKHTVTSVPGIIASFSQASSECIAGWH